jgi:hypothetical protein
LSQRTFESLKDLPLGLEDAALRKFCDVCAAKRHDISHFGGQPQEGNYGEFIIDLDSKSGHFTISIMFYFYRRSEWTARF